MKKNIMLRKAGTLPVLFLALALALQTVLPAATVFAASVDGSTELSTVCVGADGKKYQVMAAYGEDAEIPADVVLTASAVTKEDADYDSYVAQAAEALACDVDGENGVRLFDISLVSGEDASVKYQPAEGARVEVKVRLATRPENDLGVVHFGEEPEVLSSDVTGRTVSFETTGFSVYGIVEIAERDTVLHNVSDFENATVYLSATTTGGNTYYVSSGTVSASNLGTLINRTAANSTEGAVAYSFEKVAGTENQFYMYLPGENGSRQYVDLTSPTTAKYTSTPNFAFTITPVSADKPDKFYLSFKNGNTTYYFNLRRDENGKGFNGSTYNTQGSYITAYWELPNMNDTLALDGKTYGIVWRAPKNTVIALSAAAQDAGSLAAETLPVRANPLDNSQDMAIKTGGDLDLFTFHSADDGHYYITTQVGGATKYLNLNGTAVTLTDAPDDYSKFDVTLGSGNYAGKIRISGVTSRRALSLRGGNAANGFSAVDAAAANSYFNLALPSFLGDDDFVPYTAIKVSVSDRQQVHNGSQVIVYTRIWNDDAKEYEFYAINHDGSLVRCFDNGDTIRWAGTQVNTLLWDFTEYYYWPYIFQIPNYYYELQNAYSGKYIAPQYHTGQILSNRPIGINLNGRRYGDYYTTVLAWDDYRYDYAGLKADGQRVTAVPMAKAQDFYFAVMDDPIPDEFSTVETVNNNDHGISMRMINFQGEKYDGGGRDRTQTNVLGAGSDVFTGASKPMLDLVTTDLKENGYPDATLTGKSLEELFGDATDANHLFLKSTYEESGYFEYDCTQTFATLLNNGNFRVYNQLGTVNVETNSKGHGFFMPYNDISPDSISPYVNETDVVNQPLATNDPRLGETLYGITRAEAQYHFGMEMEASFIQSENGLDAWGHDIIFEFAGDDDMWLYVDGELVLDLGGVHSAVVGNINFRTGEVSVPDENGTQYKTDLRTIYENNYRERNPQASDAEVAAHLDRIFTEGTSVFRDYSSHTMKMLYMERGAGASNLHMRFNLTTAIDGQLLLSKSVSGTDKQDYASAKFPYQIHYYDTNYAAFRTASREEIVEDGKTVYDYTGVSFVRYQGTNVPVDYADTYTVGDETYEHVFFLKPGEVAEIQFPSDEMEYYLTECGIDSAIYDRVSANGTQLSPDGSGNLQCYSTEQEVIGERKVVKFDNHVNPEALRTLSITKHLFDVNNEPIHYPENTTGFRFRLYVGEDENGEPEYYRMDKYYVKNPDGKYCVYDFDAQDFRPLNKTAFEDLTEEDLSACTFTTSPSGAIDKIPADFTVEVRNLLVDTRFLVLEQESDIPKGYDLIGYERADGSYIVEDGDTVNSGIIRDRQNPHIIVNNHQGWGLTVEKVWSDDGFMTSHDNIYFAVYCKGELIPGTVRQMKTEMTPDMYEPETSLYYYFPELQAGAKFSDYEMKEVALTDPAVDENGYVTSYTSLTPLGGDEKLLNGGVPAQTGVHGTFSYTVTYSTGVPGGPAKNVRTDVVTNTRPGIRIVKVDGSGNPLPGAVFTLKDGSGSDLTKASYTSDAEGLITYAYPEQGVAYTLKETGAPEGYSSVIDAITFTLDGEELTVSGADEDAVTFSPKDADGTITVTIKNYRSRFTAVKTDAISGEPLAGVHFALYRQVQGTGGLRKDYYPLVGYEDLATGEDGLIPQIDDTLPTGTYYLCETQEPRNYFPLEKDICFTVTRSGTVEMASADDADMLETTMTADNELIYTLTVPNYRSIKTITLSPQTLVADFGLNIVYNVKDNNYLVPAGSEYTYVGVCAMSSFSPYGTEDAPALLAETGAPYQGKFGTVTLAADGTATYQIGTMSFTGEEDFCLAAHVTKISGEDADVYVYEKLTYLPATTIYYEDDFVADENYHDGVENTVTGHDFGKWSKVTSGDPQTEQAADLAGSEAANIYGFDPHYTAFAAYSNNGAHKVAVSTVNSGNGNKNWPYMEFDFAGTGFDLVSVTGCDTGAFTVKVYPTTTDDQGHVTVGAKAAASKVVDTYYGYSYGRVYMDANGAPTLTVTDTPLYFATDDIVTRESGSDRILLVGGKYVTPIPTYRDGAGQLSEAAASDSTPAYAEGWLVNPDASGALYQIPVIKVEDLAYGTYRAHIEPRFMKQYGHFRTTEDGYDYYDLYVDAFRIYDPAGREEDGTLTSSVIKEAYLYADEANEQFSTLRDLIVGAETMGDVSAAGEAQEGAVLVDGNVALTTEQINDYAQFGPNHELYLRKGMSVAFELCSSEIPADVQVHLKKISAAAPAVKLIYVQQNGNVETNTLTVNSSTDLSYSLPELIGRDNVKWTATKSGGYSSGLVILTNTGEAESLLSVTNLKWTFKNAGSQVMVNKGTGTVSISGKGVSSVSRALRFARNAASVSVPEDAPIAAADGAVTMTVVTGGGVESLVVRDDDGNVVEPSLLETTFKELDDGQRQWTVTVEEGEPGVYTFSIAAVSDGFVAGDPVRMTVTVEPPAPADDPTPADDGGEGSDPQDGPQQQGGTEELGSFLQTLRSLLLRLIDLLRRILSIFGISLNG